MAINVSKLRSGSSLPPSMQEQNHKSVKVTVSSMTREKLIFFHKQFNPRFMGFFECNYAIRDLFSCNILMHGISANVAKRSIYHQNEFFIMSWECIN